MIYGVIALVVGYLILSDTKKKDKEFGLRTEQQMQAEIDSAAKLKEARESENVRRLDPSLNARQAQENYVRGFRDYRKGGFETRARVLSGLLGARSKPCPLQPLYASFETKI